MTILCALISLYAIWKDHPRTEFIIVMTCFMGLMVLVARVRNRRNIRTLHATGRRKPRKN